VAGETSPEWYEVRFQGQSAPLRRMSGPATVCIAVTTSRGSNSRPPTSRGAAMRNRPTSPHASSTSRVRLARRSAADPLLGVGTPVPPPPPFLQDSGGPLGTPGDWRGQRVDPQLVAPSGLDHESRASPPFLEKGGMGFDSRRRTDRRWRLTAATKQMLATSGRTTSSEARAPGRPRHARMRLIRRLQVRAPGCRFVFPQRTRCFTSSNQLSTTVIRGASSTGARGPWSATGVRPAPRWR